MSGSDNILVAIKSRPLILREKSEKLRPLWSVQDKIIFQIDDEGHRLGEPYSFDHIFTEHMTNYNVYSAVVEPMIQSVLSGFNSTIFAYGQTSSGKTHTMMGTDDAPGIIQMAINDIFQRVMHDTQRRYLISCSYFEIYNEKINDLLDKNGQDLKIREDTCGNTFVNAKEEVITQQAQVFDLMKVGSKIRKIGCTNMNERSSRSHTIFRLTIKSTDNKIENGPVQLSQLNLVDLAGSERIALSKAEGVRLKEGVNINKSLLALGNVIRLLSEGEGFINYRDSNLTRLLQNALGGNAKSLIIATITVAAGEETKSTLEFAQRAKVIKNKPIINEILSEQDKLKQYQFATAIYKDRLEIEKQRMREMEQEKEEREMEILKLKQQVKLIDLFANGPSTKKLESKVVRRHTMGHYTPGTHLQTIPEATELFNNEIHKKYSVSGTDRKSDDEELFLKVASEVSNYDYMKMILEESLEDGILAGTPEPPEGLPVQESVTSEPQEDLPAQEETNLRVRLKCLEESYIALQEFTKLEVECKEDKSLVCELVKEKENLLKDVVDLNAIIKELRQEKELIKDKLEDELRNVKSDVEYLKKRSDELGFALEQAEAEKDALRLSKEQMLNDNQFILEQQKMKYEKQLKFYVTEIDRLNKEKLSDDNFEEQIKKLKEENANIQINIEKMTTYEEKIEELEEKLHNETKDKEEVNLHILDKLYALQNVLLGGSVGVQGASAHTEEQLESDTKQTPKVELEDITTEKEYENLKQTIQTMTEKLEELQLMNSALEEELLIYKQKSSSFLELEGINKTLKMEITKKEDEINSLHTKIQNLENNTQTQKNKEVEFSNLKITELMKRIKTLEVGNKEKIKVLLGQIVQLEDENKKQKNEINLQVEEARTRNETIAKLKEQVNNLETSNNNWTNKMLLYEEQVQSKDNQISELTNKIENLEANHGLYIDEINSYKEDISMKTNEIRNQCEKLNQIENQISKWEEDIINRKEELDSKATKIKNLEEVINHLETTIQSYKQDVNLYIEKLNCKDKEISDLSDKLSDLQRNTELHQVEISQYKDKLGSKDQRITVLTEKVKSLELEDQNNKQKMLVCAEEAKNHCMKITALENEIVQLETKNCNYREQITALENEMPSKGDEITRLQHKIEAMRMEQAENMADLNKYKQDVELKDIRIAEMMDNFKQLQNDVTNYQEKLNTLEEDISSKNKNIEILKYRITCLEDDIQKNVSEGLIKIDLINKIKYLENEIECDRADNINLREKIEAKEKMIVDLNEIVDKELRRTTELTNELKQLGDHYQTQVAVYRTDIEANENLIRQLKDTIKRFEMDNNSLTQQIDSCKNEIDSKNKQIQNKNEKILKLTDEVKKLEEYKSTNKDELRARDSRIKELMNKLTEVNEEIKTYKRDDQSRSELKNKISNLEQRCSDYEGEISRYRAEITRQEMKIKELVELQQDRTLENKDDDIQVLNKKITNLLHEKSLMEKRIQDVNIEKEHERRKNKEFENKLRNMVLENVNLSTRIFELENRIELKSLSTLPAPEKLEKRGTNHSTASSSSTEMSAKEIRKMKRQSIQDQKRGIDLAAGDSEDTLEERSVSLADLKKIIEKLTNDNELLSNENSSLEFEVQGFMRELEDYKKYNEDKDKEIEMLKQEIEKMKQELSHKECKSCSKNKHFIKKLEALNKDNNFKIVELQTKIYDLQNSFKIERTNVEERERRMRFHINTLEMKLGERALPETQSVEIQCDLMNCQQLLEKYSNMKKLARMRRDEGNALRARLGMKPDEPLE